MIYFTVTFSPEGLHNSSYFRGSVTASPDIWSSFGGAGNGETRSVCGWSYIPCWLRIPLVFREVIPLLPSPSYLLSQPRVGFFHLSWQSGAPAGRRTHHTPHTNGLDTEMGLRGGRGQGGKGSDGKGRGLLGALLSWQEVGGGGWLCHPIASPPVPQKNHSPSARNTNSRTMDLLDTNSWCQKDACNNIWYVLTYLNPLVLLIF